MKCHEVSPERVSGELASASSVKPAWVRRIKIARLPTHLRDRLAEFDWLLAPVTVPRHPGEHVGVARHTALLSAGSPPLPASHHRPAASNRPRAQSYLSPTPGGPFVLVRRLFVSPTRAVGIRNDTVQAPFGPACEVPANHHPWAAVLRCSP
jgi:hypothetical protein